jgi:hypothetical protein
MLNFDMVKTAKWLTGSNPAPNLTTNGFLIGKKLIVGHHPPEAPPPPEDPPPPE